MDTAEEGLRMTVKIRYETGKERQQGYTRLCLCWEVARYIKGCCKGTTYPPQPWKKGQETAAEIHQTLGKRQHQQVN